jgi:hypothetical protein
MDENARESLVVKELLKMDLDNKSAQKCQEISNLANKEMILEETLDAMKQQWKDVTIQHVRNPTTVVLN